MAGVGNSAPDGAGGLGFRDAVLRSGAGGRAERGRRPGRRYGILRRGLPAGSGRGLSGRGGLAAAAAAAYHNRLKGCAMWKSVHLIRQIADLCGKTSI